MLTYMLKMAFLYYLDYQIKGDERGKTCGMHGRDAYITIWSLEVNTHFVDSILHSFLTTTCVRSIWNVGTKMLSLWAYQFQDTLVTESIN
jgi:hypothetical protein